MARVARRWAWLAVAVSVLACREPPVEPENLEMFQVPGRDLVISQMNVSRVVAINGASGEVVWEYERLPVEQPSYATAPEPTMVCPIAWLPVGRVVIRFHDEMHALDADTGELLWRRPWPPRRYCPVAGLDSGVLSISRWGDALEKLDAGGEPAWEYVFDAQGVAVAVPIVLHPTGDTLVRTRHHLLNIAPNGELNWTTPYSVEPAVRP